MRRRMEMPTKVRPMSAVEYQIVPSVFGATLPYRSRILITDAAGKVGRAFTISTSLVSLVFGLDPAVLLPTVLGSAISAAYSISVGSDDYTSLATRQRGLLVHETAHVWQGRTARSLWSCVFNSLFSRCLRGSSAYSYTAGQPWRSYNAEQQATIVGDRFQVGQPSSGALYPYIVNHVRKGDC